MARLVFALCQLVNSWIEPSLHGLNFFLEIFYGDLFLLFLSYSAARVIAVDASSAHMRIDEWRPTASTFCPLSLPRKKSVAVILKTKLKSTIFREFPGYW